MLKVLLAATSSIKQTATVISVTAFVMATMVLESGMSTLFILSHTSISAGGTCIKSAIPLKQNSYIPALVTCHVLLLTCVKPYLWYEEFNSMYCAALPSV